MQNSKIQWCDHTFNPWIGCTKVSPGCAHCYAENETFPRVQRANGKELWGKGKPRHRTSAAYWKEPLAWQNAGAGTRHHGGECLRVFCASLADILDNEVPIKWFVDLLKLIFDTPDLDWLLLTKRPENCMPRLMAALKSITDGTGKDADFWQMLCNWVGGIPPANVWIGTSVEDQPRADERIPELEKIPATIHFLSVEPMLEKIIFPRLDGIDWAIFGGESGSVEHARKCNVDWILDGVRQCQAAGVKTFVKQLGRYATTDNANILDWPEDTIMTGEGDGFASCRIHLHDKKGGEWSEWPEDLRLREFPL